MNSKKNKKADENAYRISMNCDLCGKETELYRALVEGTELTVCSSCAKYGKVTGKIKIAIPEKKAQEKKATPASEEAIEVVTGNFGELLKRKREELGLNQGEFAKKIAEKESMLQKLEAGAIRPTLERARELEKMLGLKLVEELKEEPVSQQKSKDVMTLGDFVKIKVKSK